MTKKIPVKTFYLIIVIVASLIFLAVSSTFAVFTASVTIDNPITISSNLTYTGEIIETETVILAPNEEKEITLNINNSSGTDLNYSAWYYTASNKIVVGKADENVITSGTIINGSTKVITIKLRNDSSTSENVKLGVLGSTGTITLSSSMKLITEKYLNKPNAPDLIEGMIPIKYNSVTDEWIKADSTNNNNAWYDYDNQKWANAAMVTSDTRDNYMNSSVGSTINEADILAYYVWIPRYRYVLFNTQNENISPIEIQIEFEKETDTISNGTTNGECLSHPAFWWDNNSNGIRETGEELAGIWVGKFENSGTTTNPIIKPNERQSPMYTVLEHYNINKKFQSTNYLTEIGNNSSDAHMMKNMEWGATSYLSHSKYGTNKEIAINNKSYTGRQGDYTYNDFVVSSGSITTTKENGTGVLASTTGNVYGIYDMSGCMEDFVMAVIKDTDGNIKYDSSGFTADNMPESKYYDLYEYPESSSDYSIRKLGDATGETNGWYDDGKYMPFSYAWFVRGGLWSFNNDSGIFSFSASTGSASNSRNSSRSVIIMP